MRHHASHVEHVVDSSRCSPLEYILLGDLRTLLEDPHDRTDRRWLASTLDALLSLFELETPDDPDGEYLAVVRERFPSWHDQVLALLAERNELFGKLRALRGRLVDGSQFETMAASVREAARDWMQRFIIHRREERRLIQTACTMDVGGNG